MRQELFEKAQAESKVKVLISLGNTFSSSGELIIISADIPPSKDYQSSSEIAYPQPLV